MINAKYIGRFAPSPTGPLHFGSLVCALASFLDARHNAGRWLVRVEDIDPPRAISGATSTILQQLTDHGLIWDGELLYQSSRAKAYREAISQLRYSALAYHCDCNRQRITSLGGIYDGYCGNRNITDNAAIRLRIEPASAIDFNDLIMGLYRQNLCTEVGDFIIQRRDTLVSYQLAVTLDDQFQQITHVIRGADLLDSTPRQIYLHRCLARLSDDNSPATGSSTINYGHIPMATNAEGQKLSKQNHAAALLTGKESENLWLALQWLQQQPPNELKRAPVTQLLDWAIRHWSISSIPNQINLPAPSHY